MTNTVREQIITGIRQAVGGVAWVGNRVYGVGDSSDVIVDAATKYDGAVCILFADDDDEQDASDLERFSVEVEVQVIFKRVADVPPEISAARLCGDLYGLYADKDDDAAGTWGGKAMDTLVKVPVGGVAVLTGDLFVTAHVFTVYYGFERGAMNVPR